MMVIASAIALAVGCSGKGGGGSTNSPQPTVASTTGEITQSPTAAGASASPTAPSGVPTHVFVFQLDQASAPQPRFGWPSNLADPSTGELYDCISDQYIPVGPQDKLTELGSKDCPEMYTEMMALVPLKQKYPTLDVSAIIVARYGQKPDDAALVNALRRPPGLATDAQAQQTIVKTLKLPPSYLQHVQFVHPIPHIQMENVHVLPPTAAPSP
jgi:hypothetical protein